MQLTAITYTIVCSSGIQSQAFKWISYKTLTHHIFRLLTRYFSKHAMINWMDSHAGHVLLVEHDTELSNLIADQALIPLGYRVDVSDSASAVVQEIESLAPDVIITDLNLPGFSGKDLMIALASLGSSIPIIVIGKKDQESDILQAIRLGAADYLIHPVREAEVVTAVEKARNRYQHERQYAYTAKKLAEIEPLLEQQRADFFEIFKFYTAALNASDIQSIAERVTNLAMQLTRADCAWLSVFDENQTSFSLQACQNLPDETHSSFALPYDDELSALVAASGQAVSLHGETLKRFKTFEAFGAALIVPTTHNDRESSIIAVARNTERPFTIYQQGMLELMTGFASTALQHERRNRHIEHLLAVLQQANIYAALESNLKYDLLRQASLEIRSPLKYLMENVDFLLGKIEKGVDPEQTAILDAILDQAEILMDIADSMINYRQAESLRLETIDLNELVRISANRFRPIAQLGRISIKLELPSESVFIKAYSAQITRVLEGLLSNALKFSPANSEVTIRIEAQETETTLSVIDQGTGIDEQMAQQLFDIKTSVFGYTPKRFGGIGISLPRVKEIISAYKGRVWIEPTQGSGFKIAFSFPLQSGAAQ
jgi:K+-sensing histidine kinase KdpD